ncbi:hypothetical protein F4778DRAFT_754891 [Xylariomycetidae sp. FL2044]|nr:hypothetical protein F4778DRAFT_754891 [Xylariomycetidae sp. FL2044]
MTSLAQGMVDPTKAGKYPVVLSDALLGKESNEIYTGVRYNTKQPLASPSAPQNARIKPTSSNTKKTAAPTYDLSIQDDGGRFSYQGTRGSEESQYVLIFDPAREVFVLHKVDSMLNMNLVRTPANDDVASLRRQHQQLPSHKASAPSSSKNKPSKDGPSRNKETAKSRKPAPKPQEKTGVSLPEKKPAPPKAAPKPKRQATPDSDEESSDDDLGLTIEDPGGAPPRPAQDFRVSPAIMEPRRFSDFVEQRGEEDEDDDADGEEEEDEVEHFTLPSPINRQMQQSTNGGANYHQHSMHADDGGEGDEDEEEMVDVGDQDAWADDVPLDEMDLDLEAELIAELGEGSVDKEESDVSEEE